MALGSFLAMSQIHRTRHLTAALLVVLLASACTAGDSGSSPTKASPSPTPGVVRAEDVSALLDSYDRRNNAAIASSRKTHDPTVWLTADVGPLLRADAFDTRWDYVSGGKSPLGQLTHTGSAVYAPAAAEGEQSVIIDLTRTSTVKGDKTVRTLAIFRREDPVNDWRQFGSAVVGKGANVPAPRRGAAPALTPAERKEVLRWSERARLDLEKGKDSGLGLAAIRGELRVSGAAKFDETVSVAYPLPITDQLGPRGGVVAMPAETGIVAVVMFEAEASYRGPLTWEDRTYALTVGERPGADELTKRTVIALALHIVGATATLLGSDIDDAL